MEGLANIEPLDRARVIAESERLMTAGLAPEEAATRATADEKARCGWPPNPWFEAAVDHLAARLIQADMRLALLRGASSESQAAWGRSRWQHAAAWVRETIVAIERRDVAKLYGRLGPTAPTTVQLFFDSTGWSNRAPTLKNTREALRAFVGGDAYDAFLATQQPGVDEAQSEAEQARMLERLESRIVRYLPRGADELRTLSAAAYLDALVAEGFDRYSERKQGAVVVGVLANHDGAFYRFKTRDERMYLRSKLGRQAEIGIGATPILDAPLLPEPRSARAIRGGAGVR